MNKKIVLIFSLMLLHTAWFAQDSTKTRLKEYYLTFSDFSPLSIQLQFKKQISKKCFFKLSLVNLSYYKTSSRSSDQNLYPITHQSYSGGLQLGIEFRKNLTKKFSLYHGPNLKAAYGEGISKRMNPALSKEQQKNVSRYYKLGVPYTLGILFNINQNILIASEINPGIFYNNSWFTNGQDPSNNYGSDGLDFGFDNRYAQISIVYRP